MQQFVAHLHAAHLGMIDKAPMSEKIKRAFAALRTEEPDARDRNAGEKGAGVFDDNPQHYWPDESKVFYMALRLDGWAKDAAASLVEHATRAR